LVILDCCHSGAALGLANLGDIYERARTAVLASSDIFERSTFSESGSDFTSALCDAIRRIESDRDSLSLNRIVELMTLQSASIPLLNLPQGRGDVVLASNSNRIALPSTFVQDFISRISASSLIERQYLWLDLSKSPLSVRYAVLDRYLDGSYPSEPSWLVRRAIGTALGECANIGQSWKRLCVSLTSSPDWMKSCVGLIASRKMLNDSDLRDSAIGVIAPVGQVDAVWLASLHLADAGVDASSRVIESCLSQTSWGTIDILSRWALHQKGEGVIAAKLISKVPAAIAMAASTHCRLLGYSPACLQDVPFDAEIVASPLAQLLYRSTRRGRTTAMDLRSLLSAIYGNWRDQVQGGVREWIQSQTKEVAQHELAKCSRLPAVEARMAIFQDLAHDSSFVERFTSCLLWGFSDPHPWIRREALHTLHKVPHCMEGSVANFVDIVAYPGVLDFYLECAQQGMDPTVFIHERDIPPKVSDAFDWAVGLIYRPQ
jgi:hypothetical protein